MTPKRAKELVGEGGLFFVIAFSAVWLFNIYNEPYQGKMGLSQQLSTANSAKNALRQRLDALTKPDITGRIIPTGGAPVKDFKGTILTIQVHLENHGAASAVDDFRLVANDGGNDVTGEPIPINNQRVVVNGKVIETLTTENHLAVVSKNSIALNGIEDGWVQFLLRGISPDQIEHGGVKLDFSFRDVATGATHHLNWTSDGNMHPPPDLDELLNGSKH